MEIGQIGNIAEVEEVEMMPAAGAGAVAVELEDNATIINLKHLEESRENLQNRQLARVRNYFTLMLF